MKKQTLNNVRLGTFVIIGLVVLVVSLYMIGLNQNFFGSNFSLNARFRNVNGLMPGNNVRFAGIQCGTVKSIEIIDDTTIEVHMLIREGTSLHIRNSARAFIGSEGLMGNKVIDITPGPASLMPIRDGGMLQTGDGQGLNDLMEDLSVTGNNARTLSADLRQTAARINNSPAVNDLLSDTALARDLKQTLHNFHLTSLQLKKAAQDVSDIVSGGRNGRGAAGVLLTDSVAEQDMHIFVERMQATAERAAHLVSTLDSFSGQLHSSIEQPGGLGHMLLRDTLVAGSVGNSLQHIETGTKAFSEDMEALKHNFLLRGYFKRQQRKGKK